MLPNHRKKGAYHTWLVISTPLKNISQWEGFSNILWKITNLPNHQPYIYIYTYYTYYTYIIHILYTYIIHISYIHIITFLYDLESPTKPYNTININHSFPQPPTGRPTLGSNLPDVHRVDHGDAQGLGALARQLVSAERTAGGTFWDGKSPAVMAIYQL